MNPDSYGRMERVLLYISEHFREPLSNDFLAEIAHLSPFHFLRTFRSYIGTTPDRYVRYLQKEYLRSKLSDSAPTALTYELGMTSPSRVSDLLVTFEAVTPGQWGAKGAGLTVRWGRGSTIFGPAAIFWTELGILRLGFLETTIDDLMREVNDDFPLARLERCFNVAQELLDKIFCLPKQKTRETFHLLVRGTNFQIKVWEALLRVPFGSLTSYETLAAAAGVPGASRAVGTAVGSNRIAYLIPCHRVIRKEGTLGNYRWGIFRKQSLVSWEGAVGEASLL